MIQAIQLILSLSILVVLHELGHFIPAKFFKTKIEKFYLFFDPWFSLFKIKRGDTEYGIGWLPLGGYVKIAGMIDESMDKEQLKLPPQPWEFRSKPAWQRLIIMCGGVTVNVLLGMLIYALVLFTWGEDYLETKNVKFGVACDSTALRIGLKNGDKIVGVDHKSYEKFHRLSLVFLFDKVKDIQVERDGKLIDIPVQEDFRPQLIHKQSSFVEPRVPAYVDSVIPGRAAFKAGLIKGDSIIAVNGDSVVFYDQVKNIVQSSKNKIVALTVYRKSGVVTLSVAVDSSGTIGFYGPFDLRRYFEVTEHKFGLLSSFPAGVHMAAETMRDYVRQMKVLITVKDAHKGLGGFITIGKAYSPTWDWPHFWKFTGFLSLVLAIMNILPIPALDGGHVMFLLYEVITRRKPNEKFLEYAQYAGMMLLLALLLYANSNDVMRLFAK